MTGEPRVALPAPLQKLAREFVEHEGRLSLATKAMARWKKGTEYRAYQQSRLAHCQLFLSGTVAARGCGSAERSRAVAASSMFCTRMAPLGSGSVL